jgi:hypothetical protein
LIVKILANHRVDNLISITSDDDVQKDPTLPSDRTSDHNDCLFMIGTTILISFFSIGD